MRELMRLRGLFFVTIIFALLASVAFTGCGSSSSGDSDSTSDDSSEPTLSEVSANLPKTGNVYVEPSGDSTQSNDSQDNDSSQASAPINPPVSANANNSSASLTMRRFLWKPSSERDGNLVVLVDPAGIRVEVFGSISETLNDFGPSNDRGTTARGSFPGCSYGSNIQVRFYARSGKQMGFANGVSTVRIPNGCDRVEFNL